MQTWQQLEISANADIAEQIAELLSEFNALSISFVDAVDEPLFQLEPNATPLWQQTKIIALFSQAAELDSAMLTLLQQFGDSVELQLKTVEEQDWVRQTQANFPPQCYADNLWVIPTWCNPKDYSKTTVIIEPGLAFGTGTHPTTAMCLEWLASNPPQNQTVIDFGCGSGILALAALALNANKVIAVDHDEQAIISTNNNAALNPHLQENLEAYRNQDLPPTKAPLIIANILSGPLIELAPTLKKLAENKTTLILSGLLSSEAKNVAQAYEPEFNLLETKQKEEWALLVLEKANT